MVLVDGPAVLPIVVADDTDEAAELPEATEIPLLPLSEMPPESSLPGTLRNPAVERQLSPSKFRLKQRAAELESSQFAVGDKGDEEGEVGEVDESQEGEGAGEPEPEPAAEEAAEEAVVAPSSPSKVRRFSQLPQLSAAGGLPKWNHFYTEGMPHRDRTLYANRTVYGTQGSNPIRLTGIEPYTAHRARTLD